MKKTLVCIIAGLLVAAIYGGVAHAQNVPLQQVILGPDCDITRDNEGNIIDYVCSEEPQLPVAPEPEDSVIPDESKPGAVELPLEETFWDMLAPNTGFEKASGVAALMVIIPLLFLLLPKRKKRQE